MRFEVALACSSEGVDVYDVQTGSVLRSINVQNSGSGKFAILGDEYLVLSQSDKVVQIWSWKTGAQQIRCPVPEKLCCFAISHDQKYLAAGSSFSTLKL